MDAKDKLEREKDDLFILILDHLTPSLAVHGPRSRSIICSTSKSRYTLMSYRNGARERHLNVVTN